jgi:hypothetical protein
MNTPTLATNVAFAYLLAVYGLVLWKGGRP